MKFNSTAKLQINIWTDRIWKYFDVESLLITYINNETTFNIRNFSREKRAIPKNGAGGENASIFVCKVIISVCLFVGLSDHKSGTPRPIYLNLWGTRESHGTFLSYEILVIMGEIAKIVIYVNARVNGGTNYDYPGQRWVPKLGFLYKPI